MTWAWWAPLGHMCDPLMFCLKKKALFQDLEAQKPAEQRRPLPERPQLRDGASREEHNAAAQAAYESQASSLSSLPSIFG